MYKWITRLLPAVTGRAPHGEEPGAAGLTPDYFELVAQARQEWQDARCRFNEVADPELVDYAVYALEAAERRYIYLLQKARRAEDDLSGRAD